MPDFMWVRALGYILAKELSLKIDAVDTMGNKWKNADYTNTMWCIMWQVSLM